jgi:predicted anti-sigma-YlaC factor YlaD
MIEMKCEDIRKLLPEYHDESLLPEQREEVRRHLAGCEGCRFRFEEIRRTLGLLAQDSVPEREESFWVDFLPQVRSRIEQKQKTRWLAWPKIRWAVGLVSVLTLVVVGSLLVTRKNQNLVQQETGQALETSIALSNPDSYVDQLAEVLSTAGAESTSVAALLADTQNQDLKLAEQVLDEDYLGESDLGSLLSELSLEELKQLEQNISSLQVKDIL